MHNLLRFYNQNRKKIWTYALGIVLVIVILQTLNAITIKNNNSKVNSLKNETNNNSNTIYNKEKTYSAISDTEIKKSETDENTDLINLFIEYCNDNQPEKAYGLLSDECKELLYENEEYFINNYYNNLFSEKRNGSIELWIANDNKYTYKVKFLNDILSSGNINSNSFYDYFTIVGTDEKEKKLNISSYIGRENIASTAKTNNIEIDILSKDIFINYEIYNIKAKNNTEQTILLDSKKNTNTVYLSDTKEVTYSSFLYELDEELLKIGRKQTRTLRIKFNKMYDPNRKINKMNFTDIILDYDNYSTNNDSEIDKISINI